MSTQPDPPPSESGVDDEASASEPVGEELLQSVTDVVNAAVGVGASLARAVAKATSEQAAGADAPLNDLVRSGAAAVGNVFGLAISGLRATGIPTPGFASAGEPDAEPSAERGTELPTVRPGSTLRVPLLVENRDAQPMSGIAFTCAEVERLTPGAGPGIQAGDIRFDPNVLTVAGRDFEKLTVRIDTRPETAAGRYRVAIEGEPTSFRTDLVLEVSGGGS